MLSNYNITYVRIVVVDCNISIDGSLWRSNTSVLLTIIEGLFGYDEHFRRKTSNGSALVLGFLLMQLGTHCILIHMYGVHRMVVIVFRYYYC